MPVFDSLVNLLSSSPWTYAIVLGSIAGSAVLPLLPSDSMAVTAGVLAGAGKLYLPLVIVAAAVGSFLGDNAAYLLGRTLGSRAVRWVLRGERGQRSLAWGSRMLDQYGGALIVVDRFIPGGQTAVSLAAGILGYPWPRFAPFAGLGASAWAVYGSFLGFLGGQTFERNVWIGVLVSLGIAATLGGLIELVRRWRQRAAARRGS